MYLSVPGAAAASHTDSPNVDGTFDDLTHRRSTQFTGFYGEIVYPHIGVL